MSDVAPAERVGEGLAVTWPWWARVTVGAVALPGAVLAAGGVLWLAGTALRPLIGADGPLAGHDVAVTAVLWVLVPALAVGAAAVVVRRVPGADRPPPSDPAPRVATAPMSAPGRGPGPGPGPGSPGGTAGDAAVPPGRSGRLDGLAQLVVAVGTALIVVGPFAASPGASRWVGAYDAPYSAWLGWRIGEAMRAGTWLPTAVPDALWPVGIDLLVTDGLLPAYVAGILNVAGLGPYAAYNATLLLGVGLSIWAGRRLGLVLTDRPWVALACGLAYATAPMVAGPVQAHVAFVWSFAVPLLVRRAVLDARGDGPRPVLLAGLLVLAFACSAYHLVFGGLAYLLVGLLWPGSAMRRPAVLGRVALGGLAALVVLSPFVVARWDFERDERAAGGEDQTRVADAFLLSADALAAVTPPGELLVDLPAPDPSLGPAAFASLRIAFPGLLLLAGGGIAVVLRRGGAVALVGTAGVLWVLTLGPALHWGGRYPVDGSLIGTTAWLPFRLLLEVPGLGNLRAPYRASFAIAAVLAGATALALGAVVEHLEAKATRGRGGAPVRRQYRLQVGGVVGVALLLSVLAPLPTSDLGISDAQRAALEEVGRRGGPGEAVLVVPFGCRLDDPRIVALQIVHGQPSLGCSTSRAATPWASELDVWGGSAGLRALWCGEAAVGALFPEGGDPSPLDTGSLAELRRELGVRFVIVDGGGVDPSRCPWLAASLEALTTDAEVLADDGGWRVLDLGPVDGGG